VPHLDAEILLEYLRSVLFLFKLIEAFFGVDNEHRIPGLLGTLEDAPRLLIGLDVRLVANLSVVHGRFTDIGMRRVTFAPGGKGVVELLHFVGTRLRCGTVQRTDKPLSS